MLPLIVSKETLVVKVLRKERSVLPTFEFAGKSLVLKNPLALALGAVSPAEMLYVRLFLLLRIFLRVDLKNFTQ